MRDSSHCSIAVLDAAGPIGDAVTSSTALTEHQVTAASRTPHAVALFSPTITYSDADVCSSDELAEVFSPVDAVVLTLGHPTSEVNDEALTLSVVRAMRHANIAHLIVTAPLDSLSFTPDGMREKSAPRRARSLSSSASEGRHFRGKASAELLDTRRAIELTRLSGVDVSLLVHPPVIVAPGPSDTTRVPLTHAPTASRDITAANAATQVLNVLRLGKGGVGEFVISE